MLDASCTNNYKDDAGKWDPSVLELGVVPLLKRIAAVREYGNEKYEKNSWTAVPDAEERYRKALYRHVLADMDGERIDSESGLPHLDHAMCNLMFLAYFEENRVEQPSIYSRRLGTITSSAFVDDGLRVTCVIDNSEIMASLFGDVGDLGFTIFVKETHNFRLPIIHACTTFLELNEFRLAKEGVFLYSLSPNLDWWEDTYEKALDRAEITHTTV